MTGMKKMIYLSDPLYKLAEETKGTSRRTSGFSARLGEIVQRYDILLRLTPAPELSDGERQIMGDVLCGTYIDASEVNGLYLDVLDSVIGTKEERQTLSDRIKAMTAGERLKLIETVS